MDRISEMVNPGYLKSFKVAYSLISGEEESLTCFYHNSVWTTLAFFPLLFNDIPL